MSDEQVWCMYFAGVAAFRFHPRNTEVGDGESDLLNIRFAAAVADHMLRAHRERFPWDGSQSVQPR